MKKKYIPSYLLLSICFSLLINSCSHKDVKKFEERPDSTDLVEAFNLQSDEFDKFKVQASEAPLEDDEQRDEISIPIPVPIADRKQNKSKLTKKKEKKSEAVKKTNDKKSKEISNIKSLQKASEDMSDYPEEYLTYAREAKYLWDLYKPIYKEGEEFVFEIKFLGIVAGFAQFLTLPIVNIANQRAFHYKSHLKSARYYEFIYKVDDYVETYVNANTFLPIKYTLSQRESNQTVDDLQLFDINKLKTYFWYKKNKEGKTKKEEKVISIPSYFQDIFSALFFVRGLPLKKGDVYKFPIVTRGKVWILEGVVESVDEFIKLKKKTHKAIKVVSHVRYPPEPTKDADVTFWYSADSGHRLLKFESQVKIGSVEGELIDYKLPEK